MAGPLGTIINVAVTAKQAATTGTNYPNLYGMLIHAAPGNTVNVQIYLGGTATPFITLTADSSIRLDPAQCPNTGLLYAAAADGATSSGIEIVV